MGIQAQEVPAAVTAEICPAEVERFRRALAKIAEMGGDPVYPSAWIRHLAMEGRLTRAEMDAYVEERKARGELLRCLRRTYSEHWWEWPE